MDGTLLFSRIGGAVGIGVGVAATFKVAAGVLTATGPFALVGAVFGLASIAAQIYAFHQIGRMGRERGAPPAHVNAVRALMTPLIAASVYGFLSLASLVTPAGPVMTLLAAACSIYASYHGATHAAAYTASKLGPRFWPRGPNPPRGPWG